MVLSKLAAQKAKKFNTFSSVPCSRQTRYFTPTNSIVVLIPVIFGNLRKLAEFYLKNFTEYRTDCHYTLIASFCLRTEISFDNSFPL